MNTPNSIERERRNVSLPLSPLGLDKYISSLFSFLLNLFLFYTFIYCSSNTMGGESGREILEKFPPYDQ
jgi:hypothetical protein